MANSILKIQDSFNDAQSTADKYWDTGKIHNFYRKFRNKGTSRTMDLPKTYLQDSNSIQRVEKRYHLRGFQFGNWVTNEDRFNYLAAFYVCLYDLNKVLKFKDNNLGLSGSLGIALGSRGVPRALAHYEPYSLVINISRYKREDVLKAEFEAAGLRAPLEITKETRFFNTGGVGSFAHEYGHFLDNMYGKYTEPVKGTVFLTGNQGSVSKTRIVYTKANKLRNLVEDLFQVMFWNGKLKTNWAVRLETTNSEYLQNRQEIFARTFEQYVALKLNKLSVSNDFMTKKKYQKSHYLNDAEMKKVVPIMDKLILEMRNKS
jgi:hypothetical protein